MMRADTYAVVNLAALNLIEAVSAAYYVTDRQAAARHTFRARDMLKKITAALEQEATATTSEPPQADGATPSSAANIVSRPAFGQRRFP